MFFTHLNLSAVVEGVMEREREAGNEKLRFKVTQKPNHHLQKAIYKPIMCWRGKRESLSYLQR